MASLRKRKGKRDPPGQLTADAAFLHGLGHNRPTHSTLACLFPPEAVMVREKAPILGRNFQLDTSAGFGKRTSTRFRAPPAQICQLPA
jgi:hypothetical protein